MSVGPVKQMSGKKIEKAEKKTKTRFKRTDMCDCELHAAISTSNKYRILETECEHEPDSDADLVIQSDIKSKETLKESEMHLKRNEKKVKSLRPDSVLECELLEEAQGARFTHVSQWHTGESGYEWYDTVTVTPVYAVATARGRGRVDTLKRVVSIGTYDVTGGVDFLPDDNTPALADLMMLQNVRAIMFVPEQYKRSRLHGGKKFTCCRVFFQAADEAGDTCTKYSDMMRGLPVQMGDDYGERHFPCHWRLAVAQPNMVVLIETVVERFPPRVHGYCQLLHLLVLKGLVEEDRARRVKGDGADESVVLPLADHVFGIHGMWLQLEILFPLEKNDALCTPPDRAIGDVTHDTLAKRGVPAYDEWSTKFSSETFDGYNCVLPDPRLGVACGMEIPPLSLGNNHRLLSYDRGNSKKDRILLNLKRVKFVPRSATVPFHLELITDSGPLTRQGQRGGVTVARVTTGLEVKVVGVTVSWILEHFHPEVVVMALQGQWRGYCFSENEDPANPFEPYDKLYDAEAKGRPTRWKHNTFLDIGKVGHSLASDLASCVGNSVSEIILHDAKWHDTEDGSEAVDMGAARMVELWPAWMDWKSVARRLEALNGGSDVGRTYKAKRVPLSDGTVPLQGYTSLLLSSSLGRKLLFDVGVHAMVVQPVDRKTGWARHAVAYLADCKGVWSLHDQNEAPVVLEEGPSRGTSGVLGAWTVDVRASSRGLGPPPKKKQVVRKASGKFKFPTCPTPLEAGAHAVQMSVIGAFAEFLRCTHPAVSFDQAVGELCLFPDEEQSRWAPCRQWEKLTAFFLTLQGLQAPVEYDSVMWGSLWDIQERQENRGDVHLLLGRSDAAEWCPDTLYFMRCREKQWEVYNPTQCAYEKVFRTKKPFGFLLVSSVVRLGL